MNWDHHDAIYSTSHTNIPNGGPGAGRFGIGTWPMMGSTDQALSALLEDLHQRGLLADTLVCFVTEFGRTPHINDRQGRDHWTNAFSFAFAGAGVPGGQVVGATDRDGGYITSSMAYTIEDYAATIFEKLGIDRTKPLQTPIGKPVYLASKGRPIPELF
jgi:membrane-anchored protein YejM (alkaline phosphatase superfamily)